jgi:hypothetical protein
MNEYPVYLRQFVNTLVEFDVGKDAAREGNLALAGFLEPVVDKGNADLFQDQLRAGSQVGTIEVGG